MKAFVSLFLMVFITSYAAVAGTVRVSGAAPAARGCMVRVIAVTDFLLWEEKTLAGGFIDDDGSFLLEFDIVRTTYAYLDIESVRGEIYLQPGGAYHIYSSYEPEDQRGAYFDETGLPMDFETDNPGQLNQNIQALNIVYNDFILEHFNAIYKGNRNLVDTLQRLLDAKFSTIDNAYLQNAIRYKMAWVEQFARVKGRKTLADEYLNGQPQLINHVEYMYFFDQFFDKYIFSFSSGLSYDGITDMLWEHQPAESFLDALASDPALSDVSLRELLLLDILKSLYYDGEQDQDYILTLIQTLGREGSVETVRLSGTRLADAMLRLRPGAQIVLEPGPLADYVTGDVAGKNAVGIVAFVSDSGPSVTMELDSLSVLSETGYITGKSAVVVAGKSQEQDSKLLQQRYPGMVVMPLNNQWYLLDYFRVRNFPVFVLLNEGKIGMAPAPRPTENLARILDKDN